MLKIDSIDLPEYFFGAYGHKNMRPYEAPKKMKILFSLEEHENESPAGKYDASIHPPFFLKLRMYQHVHCFHTCFCMIKYPFCRWVLSSPRQGVFF